LIEETYRMATTADTAFRVGALDVDELIASARSATGLADFGDPDVHEPLRALVDSLNRESNLTPVGEAGRRAALVRALSNRLRLNDAMARNPQIEREVITKPIVIVGLPRSGTTKLQRVVAADPLMQKLPLWRLLQPVAAQPAPPGQPDPRIAQAESYVAAMRANAPAMYAAHPMHAREADEEVFVMELAFLANINATAYRAPSFDEWLRRQSFESWYVWFKRLLQYVQHADGASGRPWVLKAPHHMGFLPLLFKYLPQAVVVHTHRDPAVTVGSFAALAHAARSANQYTADPVEAGRYCLRYCAERVRTYVNDRAAIGVDKPFIDIAYGDVVHDIDTVVRRIYDAAGIELTPQALDAMHAWEAEHGQHKHGRHQYSLDDFGVTHAEIEAQFGEYRQCYAAYF
jgi:Sulfotransferase family